AALAGYETAAGYEIAEVTTQASFEIAELYRQLGADLMASDRPKSLSADELEQYDLLLEEQATPFEEQSIALHEANAAHARDGIFDDGVKASYAALARLLPARFGKTELPGSYHASLVLPVPAPIVVQPLNDVVAEGTAGAAPAAPVSAIATVSTEQPSARFATQHERAVAQANAGQVPDAELEFKQLMEAAPQFGGAAYNLGVLLYGLNRLDEAEAALQEAVRRAPGSPLPLTELGLVQRARGNFAGAAASLQKAVAIDAVNAPAWRNLGVVRDLYLDEPAAALDAFEHYKALTGEDRPVTSWIADVKQRAGKRDAAAATPEAKPEAR
ncbi:MAG: tetratricopeptide repeat protein, partial [Steroidobacteraceae bacterium]